MAPSPPREIPETTLIGKLDFALRGPSVKAPLYLDEGISARTTSRKHTERLEGQRRVWWRGSERLRYRP
jgi:hypothetical protein